MCAPFGALWRVGMKACFSQLGHAMSGSRAAPGPGPGRRRRGRAAGVAAGAARVARRGAPGRCAAHGDQADAGRALLLHGRD